MSLNARAGVRPLMVVLRVSYVQLVLAIPWHAEAREKQDQGVSCCPKDASNLDDLTRLSLWKGLDK